MLHIDIVTPCFNEEGCIPLFFQEVTQVLSSLAGYCTHSLIFVDDGSTDGTLAEIKKLAEFHGPGHVKYVSFSRNFGKESAIYAGLQATTGDYVALLDCDLQHPPAMIPEMIKALENGYDSCAVYRNDRKGEPAVRSLFAKLFYNFFSALSSVKIRPASTDFRLMTREMTDAVLELGEVERFTKGLFQWVGFNTKWIGYDNVERVTGTSKFSFFSLFKYAINGIVAFSTAPLRFATVIGLVIVLAAFMYMIYEIVRTAFWGIVTPGFPTITVLLLFLGGVIIILLGVIGEYIARIYQEIKRRPIYIAKETNIPGWRRRSARNSADELSNSL